MGQENGGGAGERQGLGAGDAPKASKGEDKADEADWPSRSPPMRKDARGRDIWCRAMFAVFDREDFAPLSLHAQEHEAWASLILRARGHEEDFTVRPFELLYVYEQGSFAVAVDIPFPDPGAGAS